MSNTNIIETNLYYNGQISLNNTTPVSTKSQLVILAGPQVK